MTGQEVQIILERFDDLNARMDKIESLIGNKCNNCPNGIEFRERFNEQNHINKFIWTAIAVVWASLGTLSAYFYHHVVGGK